MLKRSLFAWQRLCVVALVLVVVACATTDSSDSTYSNSEADREMLKVQITQLQAEVAVLEEQVQELRAQNRQLQNELSGIQRQQDELREQATRLQQQLQVARQALENGSASEAGESEMAALRTELRTVQRELGASKSYESSLQKQLNTMQFENSQRMSQLETRLAQARAELSAAGEPSRPVTMAPPVSLETADPVNASTAPVTRDEAYYLEQGDVDTLQPIIVKVFYGTNRAILNTSLWQYVSPFVLPAVLLLMLFAVPKTVRAIIRTYLHRVTINLFRVGLVLGTLWFGFSAVHTATQRWQYAHALPLQYGTERLNAATGERPYSLGQVDVSIPPTHVKGMVERASFIYFEFRSDPSRHFVLSDIREMDDSSFNALLRKRVQDSPDKDLFIFVHGFHNTFEDAAFRTAQIAHDSGFKGAPVFYSWPSQGSVLGYTTDENNVDEAKQHLTVFLEQIQQHSGAERIHVVAHSMGSRALTSAVQAIGLRSNEPVFNEMVLAAPDLDAGTFKGIVPDLMRAVNRLTLYASSKDTALAASRRVHGGEYQRAGESYPVPVTVVPVDTIDVSNITSGHSYIADSGHILDDLNNVLVNGRELNATNAIRRCASNSVLLCENPENWYWQLRQP